jgi:hypothetical protein
MKVTLVETGGFASIRRPSLALESSSLAPSDAQELKRLADGAGAETSSLGTAKVYDGMTYSISIDVDGTATTLRQSDGHMSPQFAKLLDFIRLHGRSQ